MMTDEDAPPDAPGELAALQTRLDAAHTEATALRDALAQADASASAETARLRDELAAANDLAAEHTAQADEMRIQRDAAVEQVRVSAERYRDLVVQQEPLLPPELIAGDSIDAVDASLAAAREIAGRVRSHIDAQTQAARVPAGAPPRGAPDLSALTPEQKISYGLRQREG